MGKDILVENGEHKIPAYLSRPEGAIKGGLIVIEEIWGLTDHIKDICNRFSKEGYLVLSPNLLSDTNIESLVTPQTAEDLFNPETRNAIQPKLREIMAPIQSPEFGQAAKQKLAESYAYLNKLLGASSNIAVVGFCFGGTYSFQLAINEPRLKAALAFYGNSSYSSQEIQKINCPILAFYGEHDERLIDQLPKLKEEMTKLGKNFTPVIYENCGHAFFNDTNRYAYNEEAATDAWVKTLDFLKRSLAS